jgi:hypothetical protein
MISAFWEDLILHNKGRICYFHNWAGYDSILSLPSLVNLPGYTFSPVMQNGELLSITIMKDDYTALTIKDSVRILPGSLAKLAKDWGAPTQKDHFPHYFNPIELYGILDWKGPLPEYQYFEPKRTLQKDYKEMLEEFKGRTWSFLEVSEKYIMGDCVALYQVLIAFFETIVSKFPIDPLSVLSAPSAAFKIWRTVQLPLLNKDLLKVFDFSRTLDTKFREGYHGGIVDVYRPHLIGQNGHIGKFCTERMTLYN